MKKSLLTTKGVVATAIGAALFFVFFYFVKVPSPIPNTDIQLAYGISGFFGALFGPVVSGLVALIGHALNDSLSGYGLWYSWIIASAVAGFIGGLPYFSMDVESGTLSSKQWKTFFAFQVLAHFVAWLLVAPALDILIHSEPANLAYTQGAIAAVSNSIVSCLVGGFILKAYVATKTQKGSLKKH